MYAEGVNKIALSSKVTTYPYGTNVFAVCKNEMLLKKNKVMYDQIKHRLEMDDYSSMLKNHSKILKSEIDIYKDKLNSINSNYQCLDQSLKRIVNLVMKKKYRDGKNKM